MGMFCAPPAKNNDCDKSLFNSCHTSVLPSTYSEPSVDTNDFNITCFNDSFIGDESFSLHCDTCDVHFKSHTHDITSVTNQLPKVSDLSHMEGSHDTNCVTMCANESPAVKSCKHSNVESFRLNPFTIQHERIREWPLIHGVPREIKHIYTTVRNTGLPNCLSARIPIGSSLNLPMWDTLATGHPHDSWIRELLEFGFPLQYTGPTPSTTIVDNHSSALKYPHHIQKFLEKELSEKAMLGPLPAHPFPTAAHVNPLMTHPKADPSQRRIIVDLSYPEGQGPNSYVLKNHVFGTYIEHNLPTIDHALAKAREMDMNVSLAVIDIERAYRNFRIDPIDWPLSIITFQESFYLDLALPFGARLSSLYVQKIAEFIARALAARNIASFIYLDDLFLLLSDHENTQMQFSEAMHLLRSTGLPINYSKLVPPAKQAIWLGVSFDITQNLISIPSHKVQQLLDLIHVTLSHTHISYKQAQSLVGRVAHIARVIRPARLFMSRILTQLRESEHQDVYISPGVRADLQWFLTYFSKFNAASIIPNNRVDLTIEADSSLVSGGAWANRSYYYIYTYTPRMIAAYNICQLEAINYLMAIRAFTNHSPPGTRIELIGDNEGAINGISSGRAADAILASVARALWFHAASRQLHVTFTHRPGHEIPGADILSRAAVSRADRARARDFIKTNQLSSVKVFPAYANFQKYH